MFFNHPISDLVSRIKNGYLAKKMVIQSPISSLRGDVLQILKDEGYILSYSKSADKNAFDVHLKYNNFDPAVSEIEVISKPGRRVYCRFDKIPLVKNGLGMLVISTSHGVISDFEARNKKVGGELLLKIF